VETNFQHIITETLRAEREREEREASGEAEIGAEDAPFPPESEEP
jgi:hypothetical protein